MALTMLHAMYERVLVEVHSAARPTDAEWDEFLVTCRANTLTARGCLVVSEGPGPTADQRKRLGEVPYVRTVCTSVVTPSMLGRGAVMALRWVGHPIRPFPPDLLRDALTYANLPREHWGGALRLVAEMRCQLAGVQLDELLPFGFDEAMTTDLYGRLAAMRTEEVPPYFAAARTSASRTS